MQNLVLHPRVDLAAWICDKPIMAPMALWGQDKPALKRQGTTREGWLMPS